MGISCKSHPIMHIKGRIMLHTSCSGLLTIFQVECNNATSLRTAGGRHKQGARKNKHVSWFCPIFTYLEVSENGDHPF